VTVAKIVSVGPADGVPTKTSAPEVPLRLNVLVNAASPADKVVVMVVVGVADGTPMMSSAGVVPLADIRLV